ncbi:putative feruloyl esterase [Colletotrichum spaethianum]|uniref:Carboxylic ester hydrolase n=1 Tax=Colletotrichum spaethianum TaxID=700344 RepID=A0AA37L830_9PEZI|nr:putative feruloyl esterase [Colletotrichum spaethianum]GKT43532.1 putative feruloyl esterase [Colletotrichum spaethianum]
MLSKHVLAPSGLLATLFHVAELSAASQACRPETFTFPDILGAQHVKTTATVVRDYKGFPGRLHEPAVIVPASGVRPFCNVTVSYTHAGHDDLVNLHVWLPLERGDWNERFMGVGGGGFVVGDVDGDYPSAAVHEGYVAAVTDGGHLTDAPADEWALKSPGNLDWALFVNFGYRSLHELAVVGKSVTREFYGGEEARYAYWKGCSTGGRQGLAVAQRYPGDFDGVLSVCPAVEFPAMVTSLYYPQLVMRDVGYWPSGCELRAIVEAGVEACDLTDGVRDGIVGRLEECVFDVGKVEGRAYVCDAEERKVSSKAVEVVETVMRGVLDEEGERMIPGYVPGVQFDGLLAMMNSVCEDEKDRTKCKGVPFSITDEWIRLFIEKDPAFDIEAMPMDKYRDVFRQGVEEFDSVIGSSPDLRRFRERQGKLLMWHGMADQAISVSVVRAFYEKAKRLEEKRGVDIGEYWRYFEVPGVNHCVSMQGTPFPWDAFERLKKWVEEGVAPEELEARKIVKKGAGMTLGDEARRICLWPKEGVWDGKEWKCLEPGEKIKITDEKDEL